MIFWGFQNQNSTANAHSDSHYHAELQEYQTAKEQLFRAETSFSGSDFTDSADYQSERCQLRELVELCDLEVELQQLGNCLQETELSCESKKRQLQAQSKHEQKIESLCDERNKLKELAESLAEETSLLSEEAEIEKNRSVVYYNRLNGDCEDRLALLVEQKEFVTEHTAQMLAKTAAMQQNVLTLKQSIAQQHSQASHGHRHSLLSKELQIAQARLHDLLAVKKRLANSQKLQRVVEEQRKVQREMDTIGDEQASLKQLQQQVESIRDQIQTMKDYDEHETNSNFQLLLEFKAKNKSAKKTKATLLKTISDLEIHLQKVTEINRKPKQRPKQKPKASAQWKVSEASASSEPAEESEEVSSLHFSQAILIAAGVMTLCGLMVMIAV